VKVCNSCKCLLWSINPTLGIGIYNCVCPPFIREIYSGVALSEIITPVWCSKETKCGG